MALVIIPATLRDFCAGASKLEVLGATVGEVLRAVDAQCPGFYDRVVEENRRLRPELAFAINGEVYPLALHDALAPNAEIAIVPALGGG
ncbi:MAG: MoaD/ThiS family protein [Dehalococcoidia bacterium]